MIVLLTIEWAVAAIIAAFAAVLVAMIVFGGAQCIADGLVRKKRPETHADASTRFSAPYTVRKGRVA